MFDTSLICLRAKSNTSKDMLDILREFKVPVGLSDQEKSKFSKYYETEDKKRWFAWLRKGRRS